MCVRYFRRIDGTIMTADCPMGWSGVKRRVAIAGSVVAAAIVGLLGFLSLGVLGARQDDPWRRNPLAIIQDMIFPRAIAGDICPAPPPRPVGINPLAPQDPGDVNDN
jgi:hypothetical protein